MTEEVATQLLGAFVKAGFKEDEILTIIEEPGMFRELYRIFDNYGADRETLLGCLSSYKVYDCIFEGYGRVDPSIKQILGEEDLLQYIEIAVKQLPTPCSTV